VKTGNSTAIDYREWLLDQLRKDPEQAFQYLNAAFEDEELPVFLIALKDVIDAGAGIRGLSKATGLHRVSLHKMLSAKGNPTLTSLHAILGALGLRLRIEKKPEARARRVKAG